MNVGIILVDRLRRVVSVSLSFFKLENCTCLRMSMAQFAMVEELAFLVKDNLPTKHLVLSVEEALIKFLQDDSSSDGVLELEPMNSYNRLLLHRLADIFGFSHESVGEGDDRHLILERCPETSIPSILVSDILWQYDEPQSLMTSHQLLRRKDSPPVLKTKIPSLHHTLEEREAAYLAARNRIFSMDLGEIREPIKQKPRNIPVVARRMIAHALGQRINPCNQDINVNDSKDYEGQTDELNIQEKDKVDSNLTLESYQESISLTGQRMISNGLTKGDNHNCSALSLTERSAPQEPAERSFSSVSMSQNGSGNGQKKALREEHVGAAKRMFAHALGRHSGKDSFLSKCNDIKQPERKD